MVHSNNHFAVLADKVRAGDQQVKGQFERDLEPCMTRMVARAFAPDAPLTPNHQRIRALGRQLNVNPDAGPVERRRLVRVLCQRAASRLAPLGTEMHGCLDTRVA